MTKTIAVLTTSRADYGHLRWPLEEIRAHPGLRLHLIAAAAHLAPEFGNTVDEIERDGLRVDHRLEALLSSDTDVGAAKTIGLLTLGLADHLAALRPDLFLLIADRYEMLAPAAVALALRIPVAHIEGGEVSQGAIDDAVRNALTKLAHLHFTPTDTARRRVLGMGEEDWRVHSVGAPSLDHLRRSTLLDRRELAAALDAPLDPPPIVVAYHPVTLDADPSLEADLVFAALEEVDAPLFWCFPNADAGSRAIIARARAMAARRRQVRVFVNLSPPTYWSLLSHAQLLFGNSSSGIMETASLTLPTVNVGRRQLGRQRARNVIDADADPSAIQAAIQRAQHPDFRAGLQGMDNPYGDGHSASRIAALLHTAPDRERLLLKAPVAPIAADSAP